MTILNCTPWLSACLSGIYMCRSSATHNHMSTIIGLQGSSWPTKHLILSPVYEAVRYCGWHFQSRQAICHSKPSKNSSPEASLFLFHPTEGNFEHNKTSSASLSNTWKSWKCVGEQVRTNDGLCYMVGLPWEASISQKAQFKHQMLHIALGADYWMSRGGGCHVNSALDLGVGGGSHEFRAGLAPVFRPLPQHFSNEHSLSGSNVRYCFQSWMARSLYKIWLPGYIRLLILYYEYGIIVYNL